VIFQKKAQLVQDLNRFSQLSFIILVMGALFKATFDLRQWNNHFHNSFNHYGIGIDISLSLCNKTPTDFFAQQIEIGRRMKIRQLGPVLDGVQPFISQ